MDIENNVIWSEPETQFSHLAQIEIAKFSKPVIGSQGSSNKSRNLVNLYAELGLPFLSSDN